MINNEWLKKYELAKKYYEKHGDLLIPRSYVVMDGNENIKLGNWINTQKMAYKGTYHVRISEEQIRLLEKIGMVWDVKKYKKENIDKDWLKKYELAKKYFKNNGDLLIPISYFEVINNERINLGFWINRQRERYKGSQKSPLSTIEIKLLEEIGMVWDGRRYIYEEINEEWLLLYNIAKKYYEEHGNLLIPYDYCVVNNDKEICLGAWVEAQKDKYNGSTLIRLCDRQIMLLEEIGITWNDIKYSDSDKINKEHTLKDK